MELTYTSLVDLFGCKLKNERTIHQIAVAIAALAEGCALRNRVDHAQMNGILQHTGRDGEAQEWTLFGMGLHGLAAHFFEPTPNWSAPDSPHGHAVATGTEPTRSVGQNLQLTR